MPKKVDHRERRERIAAALMTVAANHGLEAVSLRHVAAEAGATAGLVQHYFPTKDAMMHFAMESASARFEARMTGAVAKLGPDPSPRALVGTMLTCLLATGEAQRADGRVALAFVAYAATRRSAADDLARSNAALRSFVGGQIRRAQAAGSVAPHTDADIAAAALFATAEGLAVHVLTSGVPIDVAVSALAAQLDLALGPMRPPVTAEPTTARR